ncbi:MAG: hypothetical protein M1826_002423 [Phylliscum demangeonii]|nr:MAG: hypothetical protein M1826_002423 [Phylliscum demangeonii]
MISLKKAGKGKNKEHILEEVEYSFNPAKLLREAESITAADLESVSLDKSLLRALKKLPLLIAHRNEAAHAAPDVLARLLMKPEFHQEAYFQWAPVIRFTYDKSVEELADEKRTTLDALLF